MEAANEKKVQRGFWGKFFNFLAYGGFLLILILIAGIAILVSVITS